MNVLGIMSGTSVDGVDFVFCESPPPGSGAHLPELRLLDQEQFSFPAKIRRKLLSATAHELNVAELTELHHELGQLYAHLAKVAQNKHKWDVDLVGLHGQTVYHRAPTSQKFGATLQIGEASYLCEALQAPVVSDFRVADVAAFGHGAPIATLFHQQVLGHKFAGKSFAVHNLGGISNVTHIGSDGKVKLAFDTGPANLLMDFAITEITKGRKSMDKDGALARKGEIIPQLLSQLLTHPFLKQRPPKSCGREEFGKLYWNKIKAKWLPKRSRGGANGTSQEALNLLATLTEFTAASIAHSYKKFLSPQPTAVVLVGGGSYNSHLRHRISTNLPGIQIMTSDDIGWPASSIEGAAFALLALYRLRLRPNNILASTGARHLVQMGKLSLPGDFNDQQFSQLKVK